LGMTTGKSRNEGGITTVGGLRIEDSVGQRPCHLTLRENYCRARSCAVDSPAVTNRM
jgi:hypothetical protein